MYKHYSILYVQQNDILCEQYPLKLVFLLIVKISSNAVRILLAPLISHVGYFAQQRAFSFIFYWSNFLEEWNSQKVYIFGLLCCWSSGTSICNRQKERDQLSQEKLMIAVFLRDFRSPVFFLLHKLKGWIQTRYGQKIPKPSRLWRKFTLAMLVTYHTCLLPTCDGQVLSLDSPRSDPGHRSCSWPSCPSTYRISAQHYVTA